MQNRTFSVSALLLAVAAVVAGLAFGQSRGVSGQSVAGQPSTNQPSTRNGEWPQYTADLKGTKYSPLDQINASNFNQLEVAWRFKTDNWAISGIQAGGDAADGQRRPLYDGGDAAVGYCARRK